MRLKGKMHQIPHGELEMRPLWLGSNHKEPRRQAYNVETSPDSHLSII
jgi:hypothetical protein